ncbi:MAG: hypothetical protein K8R59_03360 [Thermoanaerobaculales bacterium]|nr:hypothetical protein [Thermoanaerobaculales bacterium]
MTPSGPSNMTGTLLATVPGARGGQEPGILSHYVPSNRFAMTAQIVAPDKSVSTVELRDDGTSRDGAANDGVFAAPMTLDVGGGYAITVHATSEAQVFERTLGYYQPRHHDADLDGIDDSWELANFSGLTLASVNRLADLDADGLNNDEEFRYRTDPNLYDSDGDGRPDGVEVDLGTDPLNVDPPLVTDTDTDDDGILRLWLLLLILLILLIVIFWFILR